MPKSKRILIGLSDPTIATPYSTYAEHSGYEVVRV